MRTQLATSSIHNNTIRSHSGTAGHGKRFRTALSVSVGHYRRRNEQENAYSALLCCLLSRGERKEDA